MRYGRAATACAALALPVTVLLGGAVAWFYKARNPDDVDITAGPAYLRPILLTTFGTFLVMAILTIALAVLGLRRGATPTRHWPAWRWCCSRPSPRAACWPASPAVAPVMPRIDTASNTRAAPDMPRWWAFLAIARVLAGDVAHSAGERVA